MRVMAGQGTGPGQFAESLRGLAVDSADRLHAAGDSKVCVFTAEGALAESWETPQPGFSVAVARSGSVYVGQPGQMQVFERGGRLADTWQDAKRLGLVTAVGFCGEDVIVADTEARCLRRYDERGKFRNDIGKDNRMKGFLIPNRHLDFAVDAAGVIQVANPGQHRVERYSPDGKRLGHFGRFDGQDPEGFPGCCNPTNIALTPRGDIVVTEKAGPRVKLYTSSGKLRAAWGEDDFGATCKNMDIAVDSHERIYVIDTARLQIVVYEPEVSGVTTQPSVEKGDRHRAGEDVRAQQDGSARSQSPFSTDSEEARS